MFWGRRSMRASVVDPIANVSAAGTSTQPQHNQALVSESIKLLSFNIQTGIRTSNYRQYVTKGWKHLLPHESRVRNLQRIARVVSEYDVVALQEIDAGSLRSGFVNQVEYLAHLAHFPFWYTQLNRDLGPIAQHGNGVLSRIQPRNMEDHKLPGAIPGRGALFMRLPYAGDELVVVMLHLSLGERSRRWQLAYIAEQIAHERQVLVMGDLNTPATALLENSALKTTDLRPATAHHHPTYPAWEPSLALDHVLVSSNLEVTGYEALGCKISDHLPIAVELAARSLPQVQ